MHACMTGIHWCFQRMETAAVMKEMQMEGKDRRGLGPSWPPTRGGSSSLPLSLIQSHAERWAIYSHMEELSLDQSFCRELINTDLCRSRWGRHWQLRLDWLWGLYRCGSRTREQRWVFQVFVLSGKAISCECIFPKVKKLARKQQQSSDGKGQEEGEKKKVSGKSSTSKRKSDASHPAQQQQQQQQGKGSSSSANSAYRVVQAKSIQVMCKPVQPPQLVQVQSSWLGCIVSQCDCPT